MKSAAYIRQLLDAILIEVCLWLVVELPNKELILYWQIG
jgi:hypothetical protein